MDVPELDQEPQAKNRCPLGVVDIASTFMFGHPLPLKGGIEIRLKLHGGSDPERCRRGVYGRSSETPVSGPEKVDILQARRPKLIARIYRKDEGALPELGKSCLL